MSWRTTGVLFAILVIVGAIVYLQTQQNEPEPETPSPEVGVSENTSLFGESNAEDIVRLDITASPGASASYAKSEEGAWVMTVPTATTVITQTVTSAITGLVTARTQRSFSSEDNPLNAYGLVDPPREIVVAVLRDGQTVRYRLQVGKEAPTASAYYVLKEGDARVHLLAKTTLDTLFALATNPPLPEALPAATSAPDDGVETPASP